MGDNFLFVDFRFRGCFLHSSYSLFRSRTTERGLRNVSYICSAALAGADIATVPFKVLKQLFHHPLTDKGIEAFLADWEKRSNK